MTVVITAGSTATANKATIATIVRVSQEMAQETFDYTTDSSRFPGGVCF